ncbi:MAG: hypothetical protein IJQ35_08510 [Bacteroidales bacterium]|nr:hypothetical protein [Bacteroidales bacterium]
MKKWMIAFLLVLAVIAGGVGAFATGGDDEPLTDDPEPMVVLGEEDLVEQAEIWRNQFRRITPGEGPLVQDVTSAFVDVILDVFQKAATYTGDSTGMPLQCLNIIAEKPLFPWFSKTVVEIRYQPGVDYNHPCCQNSSVISYLME